MGEDRGQDIVPVLRAKLASATLSLTEALWQFLESRRSDAFCTACLSDVLEATHRIDRALIAAEGRGAHRRYSSCTLCGKDRLLTGLPAFDTSQNGSPWIFT